MLLTPEEMSKQEQLRYRQRQQQVRNLLEMTVSDDQDRTLLEDILGLRES